MKWWMSLWYSHTYVTWPCGSTCPLSHFKFIFVVVLRKNSIYSYVHGYQIYPSEGIVFLPLNCLGSFVKDQVAMQRGHCSWTCYSVSLGCVYHWSNIDHNAFLVTRPLCSNFETGIMDPLIVFFFLKIVLNIQGSLRFCVDFKINFSLLQKA